MENSKGIAIFESKQIRRYYDSTNDVWFFSLVDIVAALTDSANATDYLKKNKKTRCGASQLPRDKLSPGRNGNCIGC